MTSKTDKNFIYDYLIHLDSFLLHGVSEVGTPQQRIVPNPALNKASNFPSYKNKKSPIAFVNINLYQEASETILNTEELALFNKIVIAMGLNPNNIYLTSVNKNNNISLDADSLIAEELVSISSSYIVCLGLTVANYLKNETAKTYEVQKSWLETNMFQKDIVLITIPSIHEMIADPRHKKLAWAELKKAADQIQSN